MELIDFLAYVLFIEIDLIFALIVAYLVVTFYVANQNPKEYDHYDE